MLRCHAMANGQPCHPHTVQTAAASTAGCPPGEPPPHVSPAQLSPASCVAPLQLAFQPVITSLYMLITQPLLQLVRIRQGHPLGFSACS